MDGETLLALAVVERAVKDFRCGTPKRRRKIRQEISLGGLDYWLDVACREDRTRCFFKDRLRDLAGIAC